MKIKTIITAVLLLLSAGTLYSQHYLIAITRAKTAKGCGDYEYHKITLNRDGKNFSEQSDILRKKYAPVGSYKEYYVGPTDYGVLVQYTGQYVKGGCTFIKYDFVPNKKSIQGARDFVQQQYTNYTDLYATPPVEILTFKP